MASVEQRALAEDVKSVHRKLREQLLEGRKAEEVWKNHVQDQETLDKYSESMKQLATTYWESNGEESRVEWVKEQVERYFWGEGKVREQGKDQKRLLRSKDNGRGEKVNESTPSDGDFKESKLMEKEKVETPLRVLDVGSCYNPFGECERWQVLPVDIAPATPRVQFCDFLSVELADETVIHERNHKTEVLSLEKSSYHVVIFCLLLEYLPRCFVNPIPFTTCMITVQNSACKRLRKQLVLWRKGVSSVLSPLTPAIRLETLSSFPRGSWALVCWVWQR